MTTRKAPSSLVALDQEIDRITSLCTHIARMASNIRFVHLSNISYSAKNIDSCYQTLLSMAEDIEGSATLLELLLPIEQRNLLLMSSKKSRRIHYTRQELFQLRKHVTSALSDEIRILLNQVVESECNTSVEMNRRSWRDIRTILL